MYSFAGFFAKLPMAQPEILPTGAVWRAIDKPFTGVGVRLPELEEEVLDAARVNELARRLGFVAGDWLYLNYVCWGGDLDYVYGLGSRGGYSFGPLEESARDSVEAAYTGLMGEFGVTVEDALRFPPFVRGFWGES
jgi:hypothetical protein